MPASCLSYDPAVFQNTKEHAQTIFAVLDARSAASACTPFISFWFGCGTCVLSSFPNDSLTRYLVGCFTTSGDQVCSCPCDDFFKPLLFAKTLWNMYKQSLQPLSVSAHGHCFVASAAFPWFLRLLLLLLLLLLLEVPFSMRHLPDIFDKV